MEISPVKVLLAIDGSQASMEAASVLASLPFREKPIVTVLTVLEDYAVVEVPIHWMESEEKAASMHFETVKSVLQNVSSELTFVMKRGHASQSIINAAKEVDADLIVLGARGHSGIYRVILGSTANYVSHHAECSVLVVRPRADQNEAASEFRILLAYDGSTFSKTASHQMFGLDWPKESASIHIATMLPRPKLVPEEFDYDPNAIADANQALPKLSDESTCQCGITYNVRESLHAGGAILDMAESKNTNLVFVGAAGKSALTRLFLGSTSSYLLNHVGCSVWIARNKNWNQQEN